MDIFYSIVILITGLAVSPFMAALIKRYSNEEKIFSKGFIKDVKFDLKISLITEIMILVLLYFFGISLDLYIFLVLGIILIIASFVDIKAQIIPNSLNFVGFLIGMVITYIICLFDIYKGMDRILGMFLGAGIFLLIAGFAWIVYRKEGMGLGDVKLMGMLGLFFGWQNIIQIFILSFIIGATISIFLLITRIKKMDDYIPFGPFIVISVFVTMIVPASTMVPWLISILAK